MARYQVVTPDGLRRKTQRLIVKYLEQTDPVLYDALLLKATAEVEADNANLLLPIMTRAVSSPRHPSANLKSALKKRAKAIAELAAKVEAPKVQPAPVKAEPDRTQPKPIVIRPGW